MEKEYLPDAAGVLSKKRRRRRWQKVVGALAAVVVFCTTYALILPAITEEHELVCGLEEHTHTETCYQETQRPICGLEETEGHLHSDDCYIEEPVLLCGLEETEGHVHTDDCYTEQPVLLCGQEESEDHVHSEECWGTERVLTCGQEETEPHTHSEECWGTERVLACGQEEAEPHVHTEACYETEQTLICEQEEHTHTEECYAPVEDEPESDPTADVETQADWEATLRDVTLTGEWPLDVLAVAESQLGYQESSRNFAINEDGKLKGYTRYGAWYGDPYGDWCAMFASFCLHYAEVGDFPLEANCQRWIEALRDEKYDLYREAHPEEPEEPYLPQPGDLIFFDWESGDEADHVGFVAEFIPASDGVPAQVKTLEGNAGDRVQYETYEAADSRILGYAALPEQTFYCGLPGHVHEAACRDAADELVCGLEEHIHTEECEVPPPEDPVPMELTFDGPDYSIRVQYGPEAALPEGVTLTAEEISAGSEEYQSYYDQSLAAMGEDGGGETVLLARFFDVRFELDGEKVEPAAPVSVTVTYAEPVETGGDVNCQAVHFGENGPELLDVETAAAEAGGTSFTHTQDGFSVIGDVVTLEAAPAGSTSHSVTFKVMIDGQWQTVGYSSYYYSGTVNDSQRAYITSGMAEEVFGKYGYTATTDPGYHFGYSYDDIYSIFYANGATQTNFCMDVDGGKIENNTAVQLWTSNNSTAQIFRIWDAGDGYKYITPVENSAYHVNVLGGGTKDGTLLGIHTAIDAASHWKVVSNGDGTTSFYNRNAPDSAVIDLPSGNVAKGKQLQIWTNGGNRYWKLVQQYCISNSTVSEQNADGTYNIGLTPESNGDIVCYYMPAETRAAYTNVAESAISTDNTFWSVKVRDDENAVYANDQLSQMVRYVPNDGTATVTVQNAKGVNWFCADQNGNPLNAEITQTETETTFVLRNVTRPVEVIAPASNPSFQVQYYAWMDAAADSGTTALDIIDTSGGNRPGNYSSWVKWKEQTAPSPATLMQIYLDENGRLSTTAELLEMYAARNYEYVKAPDLTYVNTLEENTHYALKELWVLKSGCDPASTKAADWLVYSKDASFVNRAPETENEILITGDTVIRLVYDESSDTYTNAANFYDYDITDGSRVEKYDASHSMSYVVTQTSQYGINSSSNYSGSGTKLAFGNRNTGMGLQDLLWGTNYLNHLNASLPANDPGYGLNMDQIRGYKGCTFGLVTALKPDGTIQYANGVDVPKLFNESGTVTGKTSFDNGEFNLNFSRTGDTYTLSSVTTASGSTAAGNLDQFNHELGSNNFWPMDSASTWGASGHDLKFGSLALQYVRRYNSGTYYSSLPVSDDHQDHNSYFGMQYAVNFNLTEDYVGPLEYYFYGDDDMWVFLDNQLVCDIGGVHSTVGEYVNLWDYIEKGDSGSHTLSFFYTERGASGSTCYMRFTLPSVSNATLSKSHGDLEISKTVEGEGYEDVSYAFRVDLLTNEGGSAISQTCRYMVTDGEDAARYYTVKSGGTISLKPGERATINGIPAGTYYKVEELTHDGYYTTVNGSTGYIIAGEIANGRVQEASFVNTPYYELPETGGGGTLWFTLGGTALMLAAAGMYRYKKRRREAT